MQDIGGCRAILPDIAACYEVRRRLLNRKGYDRDVDYIASPKPSGYRGIHGSTRLGVGRCEFRALR